jgi:hypothetical protein
MNVTYVSSLYDIYGIASTSERLLRDVQTLFHYRLPIIIFVDGFYRAQVQTLDVPSSVILVELPLEELHIYNLIIANKPHLHLPEYRSPDKDTHEYMALMNTKVEFLYRAMPLIQTEYVAWIDAGVSKMIGEKDASFERLLKLNLNQIPTVLNPGCYLRDLTFDDLCSRVWWIFIGTFFIVKRSFVPTFYNQSLQTVGLFLINKRITWEVNLWVQLMKMHPQTFIWYYALHDDTLTKLPGMYQQ